MKPGDNEAIDERVLRDDNFANAPEEVRALIVEMQQFPIEHPTRMRMLQELHRIRAGSRNTHQEG